MNRIAAMCVLLVVMVSAGCVRFPYGRSADRHNYLSTEHQPLSLSLSDTVTGETVWTLDVPVNKMAVIDFEHKTDWTPGQSPARPAEKLYWDIFEPGSVLGALRHEQDLSGRPLILKVTVREEDKVSMSPEMASAAAPRQATRPPMIGAPVRSAPVMAEPATSEPITPTTTTPPPPDRAVAPAPAPVGVPDADAPAAVPPGPAVDRPDQRNR